MTAAVTAAPRRNFFMFGLQRASVLYLLAVMLVIFSIWIPETFLSSVTFKTVFADQVVIGILGLAVLLPLSAGAFDLSCGSMLAFSLVIVSKLQENTGLNGFVSCLIAIVCCGGVGWVSGLVVVKFHVNSFIATLGMSQVLSAATLLISSNRQIVNQFSTTFLKFGQNAYFGIPVVVFYLLALALVIWYVLEWTPLGRRLLAAGANPQAARLSGVRTDRLVWGSLVTSGVIAGIAGVVYGAKVGQFSNSFGTPLLFPAFAAVFFGSTQFKARANVWGTIAAVYTLAIGVKGLQLALQSGVYWITPLFNGAALLIAVALASRRALPKIRHRLNPTTPPGTDSPMADGVGPIGPVDLGENQGLAEPLR